MSYTDKELISSAKRTIQIETDALSALQPRVDQSFVDSCRLIQECEGHVVVTGMGKSGHVGNKIAATLASTGTPSHFVHPAEASHGDLGMITNKDIVLALSNSGTTSELLMIVPLLKRSQIPMISMTGDATSPLALTANVHLDASVEKEACPLGLAPTSSTTVALAIGDALAIALLEARGFTAEDFAFSHPGGRLGKRLLVKVEEIMHGGDTMPLVKSGTNLGEALLEMSSKGLGITGIVDNNGKLTGVFTDGDLRRALDQSLDIHDIEIDEVMTKQCRTTTANTLAIDAFNQLEGAKIMALFAVDSNHKPVGAIHMHDLFRSGVI